MIKENQRQYEITFILSPNLDKQGIDAIEKEIQDVIQKLDGSIKKKKEAKKQDIAYPINKFESGYYLTMDLFLSPEKIKELTSEFKHKQDILRYFTTATAGKKPAASKPKPKKMSEQKKQKIKQMAEEITDEEIEKLKQKEKQQQQEQPPTPQKEMLKKDKEKDKKEKTELKDIDKKIDEILEM